MGPHRKNATVSRRTFFGSSSRPSNSPNRHPHPPETGSAIYSPLHANLRVRSPVLRKKYFSKIPALPPAPSKPPAGKSILASKSRSKAENLGRVLGAGVRNRRSAERWLSVVDASLCQAAKSCCAWSKMTCRPKFSRAAHPT